MPRCCFLLLTALCAATARASTVQILITGSTSGAAVDDGPILGYKSYEKIPDGTPFTLIYTFDDARGKEKISGTKEHIITESCIETFASEAPGTNATLRIGAATWEFGLSTRSEARLSTSPDQKSYMFAFATPGRDNRVSTIIRPSESGYWPVHADWRASFSATSLAGSTGSFSADNGRVSAKGDLLPTTITVNGINLAEQWLRLPTAADSGRTAAQQWRLAHPSPRGGYIVQRATRTMTRSEDASSPISSTSLTYWVAWKVPAGANMPLNSSDHPSEAVPERKISSDVIHAETRFYEGLALPPDFAVGGSPYAGANLSSKIDPHLPTTHATLPVATDATLR